MKSTVLLFLKMLFLVGASSVMNIDALAQETAAQVVDRAHNAHGGRWRSGQISDCTCKGKITFFTVEGPAHTFDVTLIRKGRSKVQRIIHKSGGELRQGSDGIRSWQSMGGFSAAAHAAAKDFVESETTRSVSSLFNHQNESVALRNLGTRTKGRGITAGKPVRVVETEDKDGRKTRYFIDETASLVTGLEFDIGQVRNPISGEWTPAVEIYAFSDFRNVQGILTPFKIERYRPGAKVEEIRCTSVVYNRDIKDEVFKP